MGYLRFRLDGTCEARIHLHLSELVTLHGWTSAQELPVAVWVVDARYGGPELVDLEPRRREGRLLPRVGVRPLVGGHRAGGVGRVLEDVVLAVRPALLDGADLVADGDHRVAEAVELALGLALGRLDHEGPGDGEGDRRRVEAVVHEALGDVHDLDAGRLLELARVRDELVADAPLAPAETHREMRLEPLRQ